ncbi:FAD/NAD(P)-binding protein [Streptomyces roseochromogenus]|uniref:FAD-dependent urate hydroxylase HpyO/Asp monooxygenase CreE-like FAD/NAD(P)-binding domain-containing protein n=1 Tax=Streptomyces roseochromogenus subsp. oscitans DS 12.976 TaxID=1352936 RepID=V6KPU5_STRRC|nr:FAD/NAD(P)-binding protein [Streptomyces roseochromogenus]EST34165.1 hypothetical protein M878_11385 [Streptomyces roseochromogenus subsp. oscitans DS 12.976]
MPSSALALCIVGAGPRGLSVLERLCANARMTPTHSAVTVHVVDPGTPGAGAVWRPEQSRLLLMNTVASQITVFTDKSVRIDGPVEPGPSLYEWARRLAGGGFGACDDQTLAEARDLTPDSYPSRAFYGCYLRDMFQRVVRDAPAHVTVRTYRQRAVAVTDLSGEHRGAQAVRLEDGTWLEPLDAVVLAQGHLANRPTAREERHAQLARVHGLTYLPPANPADVDLDVIAPGEHVLLRGLGLNFFDYMALLTTGRGGTFARDGAERLVYRPSGNEPVLFATSRRGIPYHARGENEKGAHGRHHPRLLTADHVTALRGSRPPGEGLDFRRDLWPLIAREVESVYYGALLAARGRGADRERLVTGYLHADETELPGLLDAYGITAEERWNWARLERPYAGRTFADRADFQAWLSAHLAADVRQARGGNVSNPLKAALDVLRDLRNEVRLAVDHGGLDGDSHRDDLDRWYTPLNAFLSIGPPASRIEETAALIEAGVLELTGPDTVIRIDLRSSTYVTTSTAVPGPPVRATALIEARIPDADVRRTADPLLLHLLGTGQATTHRISAACGTTYHTGGLAVGTRPYRLLDAQGREHPRRFAYGVPTESVHWATAAGIRPGVDSVTLGDSDAVARAVLELEPTVDAPVPDADITGVII